MKFWQAVLAAFIGTIAGMAGVLLFIWLRYVQPWWTVSIDEPMDIETIMQAVLGKDYILFWVIIAISFLVEGAFIAYGVNRDKKVGDNTNR